MTLRKLQYKAVKDTASTHIGSPGDIFYDPQSAMLRIYNGSPGGTPVGGSSVDLTTVTSHIVPGADLTYDLGSTSSQWRSLYVGTSTIYLGGAALSVASGSLTVNGTPVSGSGPVSTITLEPLFLRNQPYDLETYPGSGYPPNPNSNVYADQGQNPPLIGNIIQLPELAVGEEVHIRRGAANSPYPSEVWALQVPQITGTVVTTWYGSAVFHYNTYHSNLATNLSVTLIHRLIVAQPVDTIYIYHAPLLGQSLKVTRYENLEVPGLGSVGLYGIKDSVAVESNGYSYQGIVELGLDSILEYPPSGQTPPTDPVIDIANF